MSCQLPSRVVTLLHQPTFYSTRPQASIWFWLELYLIYHAIEIWWSAHIANQSRTRYILAAFDAFMTVQGRVMKSGFIFGIPELFLPNMLCWHHGQNLRHYSEGHLQQRRTDAHGNISKAFPSWSWVGWSGPINMNSADAACRLATRKLRCSTLEYPHLIEFSKVIIGPHDERKEYVKDLHYYETRGLISLAENEYYSSRLPIKVFDKHPMVR